MASTSPLPRQQRLLQLLQQTDGELSAQELHQRLRAAQQNTGLVTVYRGLKLLQQAGLVRCRRLRSGETLYAPRERDGHHLICVHGGHSQALPLCPLASGGLGLSMVLLQGFKPLFHTFELHGLCSSRQQSKPLAYG